jgi:hypothetical protein
MSGTLARNLRERFVELLIDMKQIIQTGGIALLALSNICLALILR